ncbi:CbtA family protein [Halopelagius fulvigenes]|uniref:CbtA family protein n=1 Tax=Halopelagius fulvigenes TaxID=1198324 RepID=A0ABD5TWB8_9EURY
MLFTYVKRGVKAGIVAGLVFGLLVALVGNPFIALADEFGGDGHHAGGHHHEAGDAHHDSAVSTAVTNGVSVVSGVLWGVLLGGVVFGVAYYLLEPAIPGTGGTKSYLVAAAGFVTVSGAPWLVLPPQVGGEQALPTDTRILLYGGMMVAGGLVCLLSGFAYDRLRGAHGRVTAAIAAVLPFALLAVPVALAPANPAESPLPAELATGLTGMVVFGQAVLWLVLAGTHARLRLRSADGRTAEGATPRTDATVGAD